MKNSLAEQYPRLFQFLRFCIVGGAGLLINLCVTYFVTEFGHLWYFWSYLIGTVVAWTCSFFLNARFTFSMIPKSLKSWLMRYALFIGSYLTFFWINAGVVYMLTSLLGVGYLLSITISAVLTMFGTFTLSRGIIFASNKDTRAMTRFIRPFFSS